jgi:peptidyl-tRNA hydrolase ICT1
MSVQGEACKSYNVLPKRQVIVVQLHTLIVEASSAPIVNEASPEQKARVRKLEAADRARRRAVKDKQSSKKQSRSKKDW